jgi:putative NADPH-quinone reductase
VKVSVILAHPQKGSFNHAITETIVDALRKNSHEVKYHDLYEEKFDPILPGEEIPKSAPLSPVIQQHCEEIAEAQGIVIIHPNWWGQPPAVLKGWVDRIMRPGTSYEFLEGDGGEGVPVGLLKAKVALIFNTSNTPADRERSLFGDPLERIWKDCIFGLCGVTNVQRRMFGVVVTSTVQQREEWLEEVRTTVNRYFPRFQ